MAAKNFYSDIIVLRNVKIKFHSLFEKTNNPKYPGTDSKYNIIVSLNKNNEDDMKNYNLLSEKINELLKKVSDELYNGKLIKEYKNVIIKDGDDSEQSEKALKFNANQWMIKATSKQDIKLIYKGNSKKEVRKEDNLLLPGSTVDLFIKLIMYYPDDKNSRGISALLLTVDFRKESDLSSQNDVSHLLLPMNDDEDVSFDNNDDDFMSDLK